ncbi:MAG TPA: DUF2182 domain-containing protein [Dehalococcoidia bacterium]|nr:DUF2182 domain-containing protein [Dehalococcoidia bacterium]
MNTTYPLARERNLILGGLLLLAAAGWAILIWQSRTMNDEMGLTMGLGAPVFIAIWVVMMIAMMFPTAAPMILTFARVQANRAGRGQEIVPTWLFTLAYLVLWTGAGILAYAIAVLGDRGADHWMWLMDHAAEIGGVVLIVAGAYQLTPLKNVCLSKCRTPTSYILSGWREGHLGALRMGLEHGAYCLGCCWLLFAILFPLGMMNVIALALITLLVFAEKSLAIGPALGKAAALGLIAYGIVVIVHPDALPTMM